MSSVDNSKESIYVKPCNAWTSTLFFYKLAVPLTRACAKIGIHPNVITVLRTLLAVSNVALLFLAPGWIFTPLCSSFIFAFSWLLDRVDGQLARLTGKTSKVGAFLDDVVDRGEKVLVLFAFAVGPMRYQGMMIPALVLILLHYGGHWFVNYHLGKLYNQDSFFQTDKKYLGFFTSFEECLVMLVVAPLFYNAYSILALWVLAMALFWVDSLVFPGGSNLPDEKSTFQKMGESADNTEK